MTYAATFSDVFLQTNGASLDAYVRNPEALSLFRVISVSVVANTANLHQQICKSNAFPRIMKNLQRSVALKQQHGLRVTLNAKVMVNQRNFLHLPDIVRFYESLGVDSIGIRLVQDYNYGMTGERFPSVELSAEQKQVLAQCIAESPYTHPSLQGFTRSLLLAGHRLPTTKHCYNALDGHFACIDARGDVYLGNPEIGNPTFRIGNILEQPWETIWKGELHAAVRCRMDILQQQGQCSNQLCRHVKANIGAEAYDAGIKPLPDAQSILDNLGSFL